MSGPFEEVFIEFPAGLCSLSPFFPPLSAAFLSVIPSTSPLYIRNPLKYFYYIEYFAYVIAEPPGLQKIRCILTLKGSCYHAISSG